MTLRGTVGLVSDDGLGVIEEEGRRVYIPFSYPGDVVKVEKTVRRFGRKIALDFELIEGSHLRQRPRCPHFGTCGGCLWQGLKYKEQLKLKRELFERVTGVSAEIKGSPKVWGFRNVSNFIATTDGIGLKEYGNALGIVKLKECSVFSKRAPEYLRALRGFLKETRLKPWNPRRKAGDVHYLQVREGKFTGEVMVNLIAHVKPSTGAVEAFKDYFSSADSIYWSRKTDKRDDPRGDAEFMGGRPYLRERIGEVTYLIHPNSFFQTNSYALPILLKAVESFTEGERVLDLYSGIGTFGVWLAKRGFGIEGVELNPFAVEMAKENAKLNGVDAAFRVGNAEEESIGNWDTVIVDPPRRGLREAAEILVKSGVGRIVYVSCNPKAFKLDYERHLKAAYRVEGATLIDMFPHTPHVEAVVWLEKKE